MCANQIDRPVGKVIYTQMCNERGTIECDMTVGRVAEDRFFMVVGTAFGLRATWWIKNHMPADGSVSFKDVTSAYAVINVIGPKSRELLQRNTTGRYGQRRLCLWHVEKHDRGICTGHGLPGDLCG